MYAADRDVLTAGKQGLAIHQISLAKIIRKYSWTITKLLAISENRQSEMTKYCSTTYKLLINDKQTEHTVNF